MSKEQPSKLHDQRRSVGVDVNLEIGEVLSAVRESLAEEVIEGVLEGGIVMYEELRIRSAKLSIVFGDTY